MALAAHSRKLVDLDLSGCIALTEKPAWLSIRSLVERCPRLRSFKLSGAFQHIVNSLPQLKGQIVDHWLFSTNESGYPKNDDVDEDEDGEWSEGSEEEE